VDGYAKKQRMSVRPHKDGKTSNPAKNLIADGRRAFLMDEHYLVDIAEAASEAKRLIEKHMALGFTFEEALDLAAMDAKKRSNAIQHKKKRFLQTSETPRQTYTDSSDWNKR
jgi:hypothetical protein